MRTKRMSPHQIMTHFLHLRWLHTRNRTPYHLRFCRHQVMSSSSVQEFASKIRTKHNKTEKASRITLEERVAEILKQSRQDKIRGERHEPLMADEEEENEFMGSPDTSFEINYGELDLHTRERHAEVTRTSVLG